MSDDVKSLTAELVRDPSSLVFLRLGELLRTEGQRDAARKVAVAPDASPPARNPFDTETLQDVAVFGGPDACAATLNRIADLGIERVIFFVNMGGLPHARIMGSLQRFASEVMPRVAALPLARS